MAAPDWFAHLFERHAKPPVVRCSDCRHAAWDFLQDLYFCNAPALVEYRPDGTKAVPYWCAHQRTKGGRCGPSALHFALKDDVH